LVRVAQKAKSRYLFEAKRRKLGQLGYSVRLEVLASEIQHAGGSLGRLIRYTVLLGLQAAAWCLFLVQGGIPISFLDERGV
jgi:hypothetical protein